MCNCEECNNESKQFVKIGNVIIRVADISIVTVENEIVNITDGNGVLQSVVFTSSLSAKRAFNQLYKLLG